MTEAARSFATAERDAADSGASLARADWIAAARALLVAEGVEAVKVTRLAEALGVTRGSFYWHFADRADLLDALLDQWARLNTRAVVEAAEGALDLTTGILGLFDVWVDVARFDPALDGAVRDWARRAAKVRRAVEKADEARVRAIADLFARSGYDAAEAFIRARIIYFTQIGYYALGIRETLMQRLGYLEGYFDGFTGRKLPAEIAEAHRARHLRLQARRAEAGPAKRRRAARRRNRA
jgi:AcrR family transcriptional regulator